MVSWIDIDRSLVRPVSLLLAFRVIKNYIPKAIFVLSEFTVNVYPMHYFNRWIARICNYRFQTYIPTCYSFVFWLCPAPRISRVPWLHECIRQFRHFSSILLRGHSTCSTVQVCQIKLTMIALLGSSGNKLKLPIVL